MDLSWPLSFSVNHGVAKDMHLGTEFALKYPSVDQITATLRKLGPAAMIYKIDISRAFRQIKVDPGDIDLLGFKFQDDYFIDLSVAFGYRNGSRYIQEGWGFMGLQSWCSIGTHYETQNVEIRCNLDILILCSFYILSCLLSIPSSSTLLILLGFGWLHFLVNVNITFQIHYYSPFTPKNLLNLVYFCVSSHSSTYTPLNYLGPAIVCL